jgi:hypothetical protein
LIPFHPGYNRSNPPFFQITNRFDRTTLQHAEHVAAGLK